jgi:hypothetical protein
MWNSKNGKVIVSMLKKIFPIVVSIVGLLVFIFLPINSYILKFFISITSMLWILLFRDKIVNDIIGEFDYDKSKQIGLQAFALILASLGLLWLCNHTHNIW